MVRRWICYLLALLGTLAFRVAYTGWLAEWVFRLALWLPLLGVVAALPGVLTCRLRLTPDRLQTERGGKTGWTLTGENPLGLPQVRVKVVVSTRNVFTAQEKKEKKTWFCPGGGGKLWFSAPSEHCGLLTGRVLQAWALDSLGLFWLPLRRGGEARQWILPLSQPQELPPLPQEEAPGLRPLPGGGPGEDYDPRDYRPGDPLSSIHWKLSAKRDELITRETLETVRPLPLLTFDCFGTPGRLDRTLDLLSGVSVALLREGRSHQVAWAHPLTGELCRMAVGEEADRLRCLEAILSQSAPLTGKSILDLPGRERALHLSAPVDPPAPDGTAPSPGGDLP